MIRILIALFALSSATAFAKDNDLCVCQTGAEPKSQVAFFKMGCKMWNMGQSCSKKITASITKPLDEILAENPTVKKLRVGYVGHWSSARASVSFLRSSIVPAIQKHDISVSIDNTACLATDNPFVILNYMKTIPEAAKIDFKGNQAISTGMWDKILEGKNNFWANINGEKLEVTFPTCKSFEDKICSETFQGGGTGVCHDEKDDSHVFLRCDEKEIWVTRLEPGGKRTERVKVKKGFWKRMTLDLSVKPVTSNYVTVTEKQMRQFYFAFPLEADANDFASQVQHDVRILLMRAAQ